MSKITHEQIKEIFYRIYYHIENIPRKELIDHYFLQQEKQEKLLELYKKLNKAQTLLSWYKIHTINSDKIEKYEREVFDITKQIKELEK